MSSDFLAVPRGGTRVGGIVQTYVRKKLPRSIHPAFKAASNREEFSTVRTEIPLDEEARLELVVQEQRAKSDPLNPEEDDDLSL